MGKSIAVTVAGRELELRYDFNAIADIEERVGRSLQDMVSGGLNIAALRALLWAGLRWKFPRLTRERAGELLQQHVESGGGDLNEPILEALRAGGIIAVSDDEAAELSAHEEAADPLALPAAGPPRSSRRSKSRSASSGSSHGSSGA